MSTNTHRLLSYFFILLALLSTVFSSPISLVNRDVWVPKITSPTSQSTWTVGGTFLVTWDTSSKPSQVTNPNGKIYLRQGNVTQSSPIQSGFELAAGEVNVTVPSNTTAGSYRVVLFGDSGDWSDEFPINAAS